MKADKNDLRATGEDMQGLVDRHEDAMKHNPDLAAKTLKLRDEWQRRYQEVAEGRDRPQ